MNATEALELDSDLQALAELRKNRFWLRHVRPHIVRLRDEHRTGMRDATKTQAQRCEHQTAWEDLQALAEFPETEEKRLRELLRAFDEGQAWVERDFSRPPP